MVRKKGFYSISAVAKMFSIHQQTIRLYEKEGLVTPKRSEGNTRLFSDEDIDRLEEIIYLTHQLGVNIAGVQMILKLENKMDKMQKKMNALFDKTSEELKYEKELAKTSITSSVRSLMQLKNDANGTDKQEKTGKKADSVSNNNKTGSVKNDKQAQNSGKKQENTFDAEVDSWEIDYDE